MNPGVAAEKKKYPRAIVLAAIMPLIEAMRPLCEPARLIVAGSLRRRKEMVGDAEIVYVPIMERGPATDMFSEPPLVAATDGLIERLVTQGILARRLNVNGSEMWGCKNKLCTHIETGIPIDLFATNNLCFFNYLVCRTGGKQNNMEIAMAGKARGLKWSPYGAGFMSVDPNGFPGSAGAALVVKEERDVYRFAGLPYKEPWERE